MSSRYGNFHFEYYCSTTYFANQGVMVQKNNKYYWGLGILSFDVVFTSKRWLRDIQLTARRYPRAVGPATGTWALRAQASSAGWCQWAELVYQIERSI